MSDQDLTADGSVASEHKFAGGSVGGPGECAAWCTCGVEYAGFDSPAEVNECLDRHIAEAAGVAPCSEPAATLVVAVALDEALAESAERTRSRRVLLEDVLFRAREDVAWLLGYVGGGADEPGTLPAPYVAQVLVKLAALDKALADAGVVA